jgi:TolB-like protein
VRIRSGPAATVAACLVCCLCGCGYALVGTTSVLPERVKIIAVLPFENRTNRPEIEQRVTEEVATQLSRRRRYSVVTDRGSADAVLEGAVTAYRTTPVQFTADGRASRVEVMVTVQAALRETQTDEVLWSQAGLIFKEQYDLPPEPTEFFDRESAAQTEIAEGVAEVLVASIFEGF